MSKTNKKNSRRGTKKFRLRNEALHNQLLVRCLLILAVVVLLAGIVIRDRTFSDSENRALAQRPRLSVASITSGQFFSDLESWYNDQFPGRDTWISLNLWGIKRTGQTSVSGVYLGKGGQLLSDPEVPDEEALEHTVEAINTFAQNHAGTNTYMMLVPGAAAVQSQQLPGGAPVRDQLADVQAVEAELTDSIKVIPVSDTLLAHTEEEIYYKTDHHWTTLGAYYAYESAILSMDLQARSYQVCPVTYEFEGTLASRSGSHKVKDTIEIYVNQGTEVEYIMTADEESGKVCSVYHREALNTKDKYMVFFNGNHPKVEITTTANNERTLLVFKDSYANSLIPFLLEDFEKIIMIDPRYYYGSLDTIMNTGVTDILFLYSADTLVTDTSLADVLETDGSGTGTNPSN